MTYLTIAGLAALLGTHRNSLRYHVGEGNIPAPTHWRGERRYYDEQDVAAIRKWWGERVPLGVSRWGKTEIAEMRKLYADGMTQLEIAKTFGTTQTQVSYLLSGRTLPGWRGGTTGRGRQQLNRPKRRRNKSAETLE